MLNFSPQKNSYIYDRGYCHSKINDFGQKSLLTKSSVLETKRSQTLSLPRIQERSESDEKPRQRKIQKKRSILRNSTFENPEFTEKQKSKIYKNGILAKRIKQLKQMHLFNKNHLRQVRYEDQTRKSAILNDFHSPKTNGGFSRSKLGGIYYK